MKLLPILIKLLITALVVILYIHYFFPQSWGYFTIEPRQDMIEVYKIQNGTVGKRPFLLNNMSYGMGISRKGKISFDQLIRLLNANTNLEWRPLRRDSLQHSIKNGPYNLITAENKYGVYRGKFLFIKTDRPAREVLKDNRKFVPTKQFLLVDVK